MVSPMASTCDPYATKCTKAEPKILQVKRGQKQRNAPDSARKRRNRVRSGCWREVQRVRTDGKTGIDRHRTCLGCRLGRFAAERHWRSLTPRHALRRTQPCLVAKTFGTLTKNGEVSARLTSPFLAGAEGLGLRSRSGRLVACVPPARTRPSARGFGVDVGGCTRERGKDRCCAVPTASLGEGGASVVLRGIFNPINSG